MSAVASIPVSSDEPHPRGETGRDEPGRLSPSRLPTSLRWLALGSFAFGTEAFVIAGVLPEISRDLQVGRATAGLLVAVFALAYGLSAPIVAAVVVRWRIRTVLRGATGLFVVANIAAAVAPSFAVLLVARMVAGVFAAAFTPTASVAASEIACPEQRGRALAMVFTGMSLAMVAGVPLGTVLSDVGSWRTTFVFVATLGLVAAAGIHRFVPDVDRSERRTRPRPLAAFRTSGVPRCLAVSVASRAGDFAVFTYLAVLVGETFGNPRVTVPAALLVNGSVGWLGTMMAGRRTDRHGARRTRDLTIAGSGAGLAMLATASLFDGGAAAALAGPALVLWSCSAWGFGAPQQTRLLELAPSAPTATLAANASATQIGIGLGGLIGAATVSIATISATPAVGLTLSLTALAIARGSRTSEPDTDVTPGILPEPLSSNHRKAVT